MTGGCFNPAVQPHRGSVQHALQRADALAQARGPRRTQPGLAGTPTQPGSGLSVGAMELHQRATRGSAREFYSREAVHAAPQLHESWRAATSSTSATAEDRTCAGLSGHAPAVGGAAPPSCGPGLSRVLYNSGFLTTSPAEAKTEAGGSL